MFAASFRPSGWIALLVAFAACSRGPKGPRNPGDEWLKAIEVEGNKSFKDKTLIRGLALHRTQQSGRPPDPYLIKVDADRIRGEYLRQGYLDVDVRSRVERKGNETTVIYTVDEGVRARTRIVILGLPDDPELPLADLLEVIPLENNDPFDYEAYDESKQAVQNVVEDAGYAHVKLDATVIADRASNTAVLQYAFDPGPKSTFGAIEVTGVDGRLRKAVERRLQFTPGQQYSTSAIVATQRALYGLGRFSTVRVQPEKDGQPVVDVTVDVAEAARHEIKLGGGFGIDPSSYEVRGRVGYSITGWPYTMDTVSVDLRPAYALLRDGSTYEPRIRAMAKLERQDLLWTYAEGEIEGGYNYIAYEAFTSYGPRARLGFSTPVWTQRVQLNVGWGIQRHDFRNIHPLIDEALQMQLGLDHPERVAAYQQALVVDLRDNPIETKLGGYAEVRIAEGTRYAGSEYDYFQVVPELRGFVPLGRRSERVPVLAARVRTGAIFGELAPTERFFAGGASSHRGFSERKLAPSAIGIVDDDLRSVPYGGGAIIEAGVEARIPITTVKEMPLGGVLFLDGGDVTEKYGDLDVTNLHWAIGTGLRLQTIVGPVRADFGYRLNRKGGMNPDPDSRFAFHISLGEAF